MYGLISRRTNFQRNSQFRALLCAQPGYWEAATAQTDGRRLEQNRMSQDFISPVEEASFIEVTQKQ